MTFDFRETEGAVRAFWKDNDTYGKAKERGDKKFFFLDGPPYTSGKVHIGTAWNKVLKDLILRYKRMRGFKVFDRAGYDMHGLPTEHGAEKQLGIQGRDEIEKLGREKFIDACRTFCVDNLKEMNKTFEYFGVWMDFENAYQSIKKEFMEGEWWFIKRAHEKGRLYEGERSMTWDMHSATALAKHELVYQTVTDESIYVRFKVKDNTYLVIWTTTPWTIPFNLAVMAGPDIVYAKVKVTFNNEEQYWFIAKELLEDVLTNKLGISYHVEQELTGNDLAGMRYEHPFADTLPEYGEIAKECKNAFSVVLSNEFVDTTAGTGLVHCAPGCGPEDYEVGHKYGITPFNALDVHGYCQGLGPFNGLRAREQDDKFTEEIEKKAALLHVATYTHEYPYGERSKQPVVFRTTKQWFLKVEDMKEKLIEENNKIAWVPEAAYNAFNAWLENLRDNGVSRQRYWGTPLPIWRNTQNPDDYLVVGNAKELAELAGVNEPDDLHIPTVDPIVIKKDGKEYTRVPDVLDVWVDAGSAAWNALDYPASEEQFNALYPADFILEGKDQIRGWFNLLHVASMVAFEKPSFKACYMHGFVNDAQGRKMSKSEGNYILPEEVTEKYGVDATRYYMIGAANPAVDMNYNFEDLEVKFKNLLVFWNTHKYVLDLCNSNDITPLPLSSVKDLGTEERYILSRLQSTIKKTTEALDAYLLNETAVHTEEFLLDLSRTYIQLTRESSTVGSEEEKQKIASVLLRAVVEGMTLLAPVAPFFTERVYLNLRETFPELCKEESVHLRSWPTVQDDLVNEQLEHDVTIAKDVIAAVLEARDKAQLGVRWPVKEVRVGTKDQEAVKHMDALIKHQTNVKHVSFETVEPNVEVKPNYRSLGKEFGEATADVVGVLQKNNDKLVAMIKENAESVDLEGNKITPAHVEVTRTAPEPWKLGESGDVTVYVDTTRTDELEEEGYAREVTRRVQQLRKEAGLVKKDRIDVTFETQDATLKRAVEKHKEEIAERTGTENFQLNDAAGDKYKIKGAAFSVTVAKK